MGFQRDTMHILGPDKGHDATVCELGLKPLSELGLAATVAAHETRASEPAQR